MASWRDNMPKGMRLRHATDIACPGEQFLLKDYVRTKGVPTTEQLPLDLFVAYGEWFQRQAVPHLDGRKVVRVALGPGGFRLSLDDGDAIEASRVVMATGLKNQQWRPAPFAGLPARLASHAWEHTASDHFRGRRVAVIGRGQSACESAVLLHEAGADVELISRGAIHWIGAETPESAEQSWRWRLHKALTPKYPVGPFPLNWCVDMPGLMNRLPAGPRDWIGTRTLRPAATAWLRPRSGGMKINAGRVVVEARAQGERVSLRLDDGTSTSFDHVMLATGYRIDVAKLGILDAELLGRIACIDGSPVLAAGFESSVPGLHFVGASAVRSFGPLMRFVAGTGYAARAVVRSIVSSRT